MLRDYDLGEFRRKWTEMVDTFGLHENKWAYMSCSPHLSLCKKMESFGLPCEHIIAVLVFLDVAELPNTLVAARWTKNAKDAILGIGGR
ncbi:unnamed protein product [Trifolium pratense]|uniref:Uncharacterized protein n=1 Tax=Trifolium pratense TaxID=57577 RepID=A0ACB0KP99_TRIPR|nr:unnamed protein product [Trifolium pratense]